MRSKQRNFESSPAALACVASRWRAACIARAFARRAGVALLGVGFATGAPFAVAGSVPTCALDATFGPDGRVMSSVPDSPPRRLAGTDAVLDAEGRLFVAVTVVAAVPQGFAEFAVARFDRDGRLDASYGVGGYARRAIAGASTQSFAQAIALAPDGSVTLGGYATIQSASFAVAAVRFLPDGTPDPSFGDNGLSLPAQAAQLVGENYAFGVVRDAKGRTVLPIAGAAVGSGLAALRLDASGVLDTSFGNNGIARVPTAAAGFNTVGAYDIAIDATQRIVIANGSSSPIGQGNSFVVGRLDASGSPDSTFGNAGVAHVEVSDGTTEYSIWNPRLLVRADGAIAMAGVGRPESVAQPSDEAVVAQVTSAGIVDNTFGGDGHTILAWSTDDDFASALAEDADGRLIVAGQRTLANSLQTDFAVTRLGTDGNVDPTFCTGTSPFTVAFDRVPDAGDYARAVAISGDRIVLAGTASDFMNTMFSIGAVAVTRIGTELLFANGFE